MLPGMPQLPARRGRSTAAAQPVRAAFFGVGAPEAILVGVVALVVFGPKGLAQVGVVAWTDRQIVGAWLEGCCRSSPGQGTAQCGSLGRTGSTECWPRWRTPLNHAGGQEPGLHAAVVCAHHPGDHLGLTGAEEHAGAGAQTGCEEGRSRTVCASGATQRSMQAVLLSTGQRAPVEGASMASCCTRRGFAGGHKRSEACSHRFLNCLRPPVPCAPTRRRLASTRSRRS